MTLESGPRRRFQRWGIGLVLMASLCVASCVEIPVRRQLQMSFAEDGSLSLSLVVRLAGRDDVKDSVKQRLDREEQMLLRGEDLWPTRFDAARAGVETLSWRKEDGRLRELKRSVEISHGDLISPDGPLARFWSDTPILSEYSYDLAEGGAGKGVATLVLFPGPSSRATRREVRRLEGELSSWSSSIFKYLQSSDALYTYLESNPTRALVCFGDLLESDLELPPLTEQEEALTEAVADAMLEVLAVLVIDGDDEESLDEVSRRVFDPFPARVSVELPSKPVEMEGFIQVGDRLIVPGLSLWAALEELGRDWLWPNPLLATIEHQRAEGDEPFDLQAFAAEPRHSEPPPTVIDVEDQIRSGLTPEDMYRVSWQLSSEKLSASAR